MPSDNVRTACDKKWWGFGSHKHPVIDPTVHCAQNPGSVYYDCDVGTAHTCLPKKGDPGIQGIQGIPGGEGRQGTKGDKGDQGVQGVEGIQGIQGERGPLGIQGEHGEQGIQGGQGIQGDMGPRGSIGVRGPKGDVGAAGDTGSKGERGPSGVQGDTGDKGEKGDKGLQGDQGNVGPRGLHGPQGIQGIKGDKGGMFENLTDVVRGDEIPESHVCVFGKIGSREDMGFDSFGTVCVPHGVSERMGNVPEYMVVHPDDSQVCMYNTQNDVYLCSSTFAELVSHSDFFLKKTCTGYKRGGPDETQNTAVWSCVGCNCKDFRDREGGPQDVRVA